MGAVDRSRKANAETARNAVDGRRWAAVVSRDAGADGSFVYSVASTGVYCRPSCPSRQARRDNVRFHDSPREAEAAGFRPCKRCRPDEASLATHHAQLVADACRAIETACTAGDEPPALTELAAAAGFSPHHFHRVFKSIVGLTPKTYASAQRRARVGAALRSGATVTEAIHEAGFGSASRFYAGADAALGMSPADYKAGGRDTEMAYAVGRCSLGALLVAASRKGITAILIGDTADPLIEDLKQRFPRARIVATGRDIEHLLAKVIRLVEQPARDHDLPLDIRGTAFQARVWQALTTIPPGATATYAEIARRIGAPQAVRAVAGACAANPVAVAIPCHRVLRSDGALSGYRWGVTRKRILLDREKG